MKEKEEGKISVIMGIYNCMDTLPQAIESILAQTYVNWELVMCDDASTDDTYAVAKEYADRYPEKIILIRNEQNMKLAYTLNVCLSHATGYYIARMDADDISHPERFEREFDFLKTHPEYSLVGTAMERFGASGVEGYIVYPSERPDRFSLRYGTPFCHATIMTYKSVFDKLGGYTVAKRTERGQDYDLWFKFYAAGYEGANIPEPLYMVREDVNAIKRRSFKARIIMLQTTFIGYKMLRYPIHWYVRPCISAFKGLIPSRIFMLYRKYQKKNGIIRVY